MNVQANRPEGHLTTLPTLILLLVAIFSLGAIVQAHDPVGLLGWLFGFAAVLTAGSPSPQADPQAHDLAG